MLGLYDSRANRELKEFLFRHKVKEYYSSVRAWLNYTISVLIVSHDTSRAPKALTMKVKTLLLVVGFSVSILLGGALSLGQNKLLKSSLQAERAHRTLS